jgi:hypothetical protein
MAWSIALASGREGEKVHETPGDIAPEASFSGTTNRRTPWSLPATMNPAKATAVRCIPEWGEIGGIVLAAPECGV